jgi:predicted transcriptional regulator
MKINKEMISLRLDPTLIKKIEKQAEKEDRTKSNLIQLAIKKYLESVKQD